MLRYEHWLTGRLLWQASAQGLAVSRLGELFFERGELVLDELGLALVKLWP